MFRIVLEHMCNRIGTYRHESLQLYWHSPSIVLAFFFDCTGVLLRLYCHSPLLVLNHFFDFTEIPSPQRLHGEPSPSQRRAFAISITSLRQLVESKGTLQSTHRRASDNPIKRYTKSIALLLCPQVAISLFHPCKSFICEQDCVNSRKFGIYISFILYFCTKLCFVFYC